MRTVSFSQARSSLKQVLDRVEADADFTIITRRDAGDAVVMSLDTFNGWKETLYLLSSPANARRLAESVEQLKSGAVRPRVLEDAEATTPHSFASSSGGSSRRKPSQKKASSRARAKPARR